MTTTIKGSLAVCCFLCALSVSGCDEITDRFSSSAFVEVASEHTKLIDGIESYQSIEEAERKFPAWEVLENSSLSPSDGRPPFNIYKVAIKNYSDLGVHGELQLRFFNNRLAEARFLPNDFDKYIDLLTKREGITFHVTPKSFGSPEATLPPYTRVWIYRDTVDTKYKYVGWEDRRLAKEIAAWIKRYS